MSCPGKKDTITRYVTGELDRPAREELEKHLGVCTSCREELALAESLEELLRDQPLVPAPSGFALRVMRAVERIDTPSVETIVMRLERVRQRFLIWEDVLTAGALGVIVVPIAYFFATGYDGLTDLLHLFTTPKFMDYLLAGLGVRGGGFNITYFTPIFVVLSLAFGLAYSLDLLRPRFIRTIVPFL
jgi:hypothetical protein